MSMKYVLEQNPIPVMKDCIKLLQDHKVEAGTWAKGLDLDPDWTRYEIMANSGHAVLVTARVPSTDVIVGYTVTLIDRHLHYNFKLGHNDLIYIRPSYRGYAIALIKHTERHLKALGVDVMTMSVKPHIDFRKVLDRLDYTFLEYLYFRRI